MVFAQTNGKPTPFFDPQTDALAIKKDSVIQLLVSEYALAKSASARLGAGYSVSRMYKDYDTLNGPLTLIIEGRFDNDRRRPFIMAIPLIPDDRNRFYYASSQALVCSQPGCSNCSIQNGDCTGCCATNAGRGDLLPFPLLKIPISPDE